MQVQVSHVFLAFLRDCDIALHRMHDTTSSYFKQSFLCVASVSESVRRTIERNQREALLPTDRSSDSGLRRREVASGKRQETTSAGKFANLQLRKILTIDGALESLKHTDNSSKTHPIISAYLAYWVRKIGIALDA